MSDEEIFAVGAEVMARWEGSRRYYKAIIISRLTMSENFQVEFEDGEERTVHLRNMKALEQRRRSSRQARKTPSPQKQTHRRSASPGRSRSPSRSPSRGRKASPSRSTSKRPTSPSSPSKSRPSTSRKPPSTPPTPRRSRSKTSETTQRAMLRELEVPLEKVSLDRLSSSLERRYPSRRKAVEEQVVEEVDRAEAKVAHPPKVTAHLVSKVSRVLLSVVVVVVMSALPIYLYLACTKNKAILLGIPPIPKRIPSYLSFKANGVLLAWVSLQLILGLLPLGKMASSPDQSRFYYRMNGLSSLMLSVCGVSAVAYYRLLPLNYFWENHLRFISSSIVFSLVASVSLYVKSFWQPGRLASSLSGKNVSVLLVEFCTGREVNPKLWGTVDLKLFILRLGLTSWALVDSLLLYKYFGQHGCVSFPLAACSLMQLLYIVDNFYNEESLLATSTFLYDGVGFLLTMGFCTLLPFVYSLPVLYMTTLPAISQSSVAPSRPLWWSLAPSATLFLIGLVLVRKSLADKYAFKSNPYSPAVAHLVTIPAGFTRCLVSSGLWGFVRHPNYLGEIMMFVAWTLPCGFDSALPYVPAAMTIVSLVARCLTSEADTRRRHGQAWLHYISKVHYRIVPYVF